MQGGARIFLTHAALGIVENARIGKSSVPARHRDREIDLSRAIVDRWTRRILHAGAGWKNNRAFCVPNDYSGAIASILKAANRAALSLRAPNTPQYATRSRNRLIQLVHEETGRQIVRDVVQTREVYKGEHLAALPDLLVLWTSESLVTGVRSPRVGTIHLESPERRTGAHRPFGFLVAFGSPHPQGPT